MKNDIPEMIRTKPELFDYQDCSDAKFADPEKSPSFEHLPDYLKQALAASKAKRESQPAQP